jgi:hypothetical protein
MKIVILGIVFFAASNAWAVDYPKEMIGKWINSTNNQKVACRNPQLVIEINSRYDEFDVACVPTQITIQKVSSTITKYVAIEKCEREDSKWTQTTTFVPGGLMLVTEKRKLDETLLKLKYCQ